MCSLTLSNYIANQIGNDQVLLNKMKRRAFDASPQVKGLYDSPNTNLRSGFAKDLRQAGVRKETIQGDRVYFVGQHTDCNYTAFFIKRDKRADEWARDDNNPTFHEVLRNALDSGIAKIITDPKDEAKPDEAFPSYKKTKWFNESQKYLEETESEDKS